MKRAGVIGDPVAHSLSPAIFSFLRQRIGRADFLYEALEVAPADLSMFVSKAKEKNFLGFNVTIPHKENILPLLSAVDESVKAIGAANVVRMDTASGAAVGFNTDVEGVIESLNYQRIDFAHRDILILGAGGAARAVAYALGTRDVRRIAVFNKTFERARRLTSDFGTLFPNIQFEPVAALEDLAGRDFNLVANATPLGMAGILGAPSGLVGANGSSAHGGFAKIFATVKAAAAFDLIYKPSVTPFMQMAERAGARAFGGLEMLAFQALASWEIWFGKIPGKKETAADLLSHLRRLLASGENIFLTGFMGVGKSTIGRILAERTGKKFIDVDDEIAKQMKKPVARIFEEDGESKFRAVEAEIVGRICGDTGLIISLGGGALGTPGTLEKIRTSGRLFYLSATVDELTARLERSKQRPLMIGAEKEPGGIRARVETLLQKRENDYLKADYEIMTAGRPSAEVAAEIAEKILSGKIMAKN